MPGCRLRLAPPPRLVTAAARRAAGGERRRLAACWHGPPCPPLGSLVPSRQENLGDAFAAWQRVHGRSYSSAREASRRREVFAANAAYVASQNAKNGGSLVLELNQFADLTFEEFASTHLGYNPELR